MSCFFNWLRFNKSKLFPFYVFFTVFYLAILTNNFIVKAAKLTDGTWTQSGNPGTTTIQFTNNTEIPIGAKIVLTFPATAEIDGTGSNISLTGQTTPQRGNNTTDNTITIVTDTLIASSTPLTITMTDALTVYITNTYIQESLAINTQTSADVPLDFGVAIITNDNQTTVTTQVPLFVTMSLDDTSIELGTLSTATVKEADQSYTINSNNRTGVTVRIIADGPLNDAFGNTINAVADGTVTAGSEEYGISIDNVSDLTIAVPFNTGDNAVPQVLTTLASSTNEIADATFDINYKASISGTTIAGTYDQVITVTISTNA